jgi:hypothetical protein
MQHLQDRGEVHEQFQWRNLGRSRTVAMLESFRGFPQTFQVLLTGPQATSLPQIIIRDYVTTPRYTVWSTENVFKQTKNYEIKPGNRRPQES